MKKHIILIVFIIATLTACKQKGNTPYTYLKGQVKGSTQRYILLSKGMGHIIDTITLDKENNFSAKLKVEEGLYTLIHGVELQYVYLQPKAKTIVNLDANDIDGIDFKGDNADKNRLIVDNVLEHTSNKRFFRGYYRKDYKLFRRVFDSVIKVKQDFLQDYKAKNNPSQTFMDILEMAILYKVYAQLEEYSIHHLRYNIRENMPSYTDISENRRKLNMTRDQYMFFSPYYRTMFTLVTNDAYLQGHKLKTDGFTSALIRNIDKRIKDHKVKNFVIYDMLNYFMLNKASDEDSDRSIDTFFEASDDQNNNTKIQNLVKCIDHYKKGYKIPNFKVYGYDDETLLIKDLMKNHKTAILFNNQYYPENETTERLNNLMEEFPQVNFIVINKNTETINKFNTSVVVSAHQQSRAKDASECHLPMLLLLDEDGVITSDFLTPFSQNIISKMYELIKN